MWSPYTLLLLIAPYRLAVPDNSNVVTIVAHDFALELPDSIPAGLTTFRLRNQGTEFHIAALERLDEGKTLADFVAALRQTNGQGPAWAREVGGPAATIPGQEASVTLVLAPGHYVVYCDITSHDGTAHWKKGMIRALTVTPSSRTTAPPASDVTINLVDYDFQVSTPITAGAHTIRVTNTSSQSHMLAVMRFAPGKTLADLMNWDHHSPMPVEWAGGTTGISPGAVSYVPIEFRPGDYGLFCFNDNPDGTSHADHGMLKQFTVR